MVNNLFVDKLIERVREVPLSDVLGTRIDLQRSGTNHLALCPFHADENIGSFVSTDRKKVWKCFSCGSGGDVIRFVSDFEKISYLESAFKIGLEMNIIKQEHYEQHFLGKTFDDSYVDELEMEYQREWKKQEPKIAKATVLDRVFRLFIECSSLSVKHLKHLQNVRKLTDERIIEGLYFTFPSRSILPNFLESIQDQFGSLDVLQDVPGFFMDAKRNEWTFVNAEGLGIGIKDSKDRVVGIQIRRDENRSPRYYWFSSSFAMDGEDATYGTSSGSPVDVVFPKTIRNRSVLVTEGRFKSEILAESTGSVVLSVQGVTTWKGIVKELRKLPVAPEVTRQLSGYQISAIMTAFDSDISENIAVYNQLRKMTNAIERAGYVVYYLYWDSLLGKGIDDVIISGNQSAIQRYDKEAWDKIHEYMVAMMLAYTKEKEAQKVSKDIVEMFFQDYMMQLPALKRGELSRKEKERLKKEEAVTA